MSKKKRNGLSDEVFERMYEEQKGLCFICGEKPENKKLCVDHDHRTGKTRRLLCNRCNAVIGFLQEDPILGEKISSYIIYFRALYIDIESIIEKARPKVKSKTKEEYLQYLIVKSIETLNPKSENIFLSTENILNESIKNNENKKVKLSARVIGRIPIKLGFEKSRSENIRGIYFNKELFLDIKKRLAIE